MKCLYQYSEVGDHAFVYWGYSFCSQFWYLILFWQRGIFVYHFISARQFKLPAAVTLMNVWLKHRNLFCLLSLVFCILIMYPFITDQRYVFPWLNPNEILLPSILTQVTTRLKIHFGGNYSRRQTIVRIWAIMNKYNLLIVN